MVKGNFYNKEYVSIQMDYLKVVNCVLSCINQIQLDNANKLKEFFKQKHKSNMFYKDFNFENN